MKYFKENTIIKNNYKTITSTLDKITCDICCKTIYSLDVEYSNDAMELIIRSTSAKNTGASTIDHTANLEEIAIVDICKKCFNETSIGKIGVRSSNINIDFDPRIKEKLGLN